MGAVGSGVLIASNFWKVVYDPEGKEIIAFIAPHSKLSKAYLLICRVAVNEVENRIGFNFFNLLEDGEEEVIESQIHEMW
ncbi:MAG: DNA/RNA non-specific endonuclease [Deltaproteobacteria bacterium]|nr:DNA/RNA non-specific endonuclease [Deltaproteobacteria bacterium]